MPTTKPASTRIILSGTEADRFIDTAYNFARCRDTLVSFLYAEQKGTKWFEDRLRKYPGLKIMADSGAHSFRTEGYCPKWPDLAWFEDYVTRYRDWILDHKDYLNLVVNLDADVPCGMANMLRWDDEIFRPLERAGIPVCYVWHQNYGFDFWLEMCRNHEYVGLPGNLAEPEWHKMMKPAIMNGCRVHGFAATKSFILGKVPLATADSISWKSGEMYGQTFVFESGKLRTYDKTQKDARLKYKARWTSMGVDWNELEQDKANAITQVCAIAWGDYQEHVTTMTTKLAYWNKTSQMVDEFVAANGNNIHNLTQAQVGELFDKAKFDLPLTSDAQAQTDLAEIRAFLARDCEVIFALPDDRIEYWLKALSLAPEKDTRADKEATIRQALYKTFYKLQAAEAMGRATEDTVEPIKTYVERDEPLRPYATVDVDLPMAPGGLLEDQSPQVPALLLSAPEGTTQQNMIEGGVQAKESVAQPAENAPSEAATTTSNPLPDKGFASEISDSLLRARVGYGVDLIFEQNKLKQEATQLRLLRREPKKQKTLSQKVAKLGVEITDIVTEAGPALAAKMQKAADDAFTSWLAARSPDAEKKALAERERKLPAQALRLAQDPALASQIGRLGGAPRGNQNARKHGLYSPRLPQLACDNCPHIQVCPQYRAGHVCAFLNEFALWSTDKQQQQLALLEDLLQSQMIRLRRAMMFETFEGGMVNKEVTKLTREVANLTKLINDIKMGGAPRTPGSPPPVNNEPQRPSMLAEIFSMKKGPDGAYAPVTEPEKKG